MKRPSTWCGVLVALAACDPQPSTASELQEFRGDALECVDPSTMFEPYEDDLVRISSPGVLEAIREADFEVDDKTGTVVVNKISSFQCRCDDGCGGSVCEVRVDPHVATCTGTCDGTISSDGQPCFGCGWHIGTDTPSPTDPSSGELDPTGEPGPKPPGADPGPGNVDPTW